LAYQYIFTKWNCKKKAKKKTKNNQTGKRKKRKEKTIITPKIYKHFIVPNVVAPAGVD